MPRLQNLFECVARALCDAAGPKGAVALRDVLLTVVRSAHKQIAAQFTDADLRDALREAVAAPQDTFDLMLGDAVTTETAGRAGIKRHEIIAILELLQPVVREALRRPGDVAGSSVPQQLRIGKPDDWLIFFPDRLARFKPGEAPPAYDDWQLTDLRGFGPFGEAWHGLAEDTAQGTACLKFITDRRAAVDFDRHEKHFQRILDLAPASGLVPLRSVYLLADPPCLEAAFVAGYNAAGLIRDWRWRDEPPRPEQAALIVKRVAKIVGGLHLFDPPIVHRGLKPANILLHPTAEGKVSIWVSDLGWAEISSALALSRSEQVQAKRQARRGALASLYASPEQRDGRPPDPRDNVYALGVIWHQLLKRDLTAQAPEGSEWALELRKAGLSDGHARLLASCIDPDPEHRPANGLVLASQVGANLARPRNGAARTFVLKDSSTTKVPLPAGPGQSRRAETTGPLLPELLLRNSLGMNFALIPAGEFRMGSPADEKGRRPWEGPVHRVRLTRPFYLGIFPVTQEQFQRVSGRNPSHFTHALGGGPQHPVEQVSWDEAVDFCSRLMEVPEESAEARIYRLPTEAEWEYACRAGATTPYAFGTTATLKEMHFFGLSAATWAKSASTAGKTAKVGERPPNSWGLHDMHGNVLEWCNDWWSEDYYAASPTDDPIGPRAGVQKVVRGGSFSQFAADCRSAARFGRAPSGRLNTVGFRVAISIPGR